MERHEKAVFGPKLLQLAAMFGQEIGEVRVNGYFEELAFLPLDTVLAAIAQARAECRFFPSVAELRALAGVGGTPSIGLVNKLIVAQLSQPRGDWMQPKDPFLREVFERLGGPRVVGGMEDKMRLQQLPKIVPGVIEWCRLRGHAVPTEATAGPLPAITHRTGGDGAIEGKSPESSLADLKRLGEDMAKRRKAGGWDFDG